MGEKAKALTPESRGPDHVVDAAGPTTLPETPKSCASGWASTHGRANVGRSSILLTKTFDAFLNSVVREIVSFT